MLRPFFHQRCLKTDKQGPIHAKKYSVASSPTCPALCPDGRSLHRSLGVSRKCHYDTPQTSLPAPQDLPFPWSAITTRNDPSYVDFVRLNQRCFRRSDFSAATSRRNSRKSALRGHRR